MDNFCEFFEKVLAPIVGCVTVASCALSFSYLLSGVGFCFFKAGANIKDVIKGEVEDNE